MKEELLGLVRTEKNANKVQRILQREKKNYKFNVVLLPGIELDDVFSFTVISPYGWRHPLEKKLLQTFFNGLVLGCCED